MTPAGLNLPGRLARTFVESRLTLPLILATLLFGLVGLTFTPREENPQIVVPAVEVRVSLPGADPEEVEHVLLTPLEATLGAISGVKHSYGTALPAGSSNRRRRSVTDTRASFSSSPTSNSMRTLAAPG
ncbi:MAG: efflux RND transporter permease subunit, partial [Pseudomonadota bacterium]|nr:efflux RND transporter permease subunit [Pseudomonadota bacterium]